MFKTLRILSILSLALLLGGCGSAVFTPEGRASWCVTNDVPASVTP